jgi:hypothetical protein
MVAETMQKVTLVEGAFSTNEASKIVNTAISEQINTYKIRRLHTEIGSEYYDIEALNVKINDLKQEKTNIQAIINEAKIAGRKVFINTSIDVSIL